MKKLQSSIIIIALFTSAFAQNKPPYVAPSCIGSGVSTGTTASYQITGTVGQMVYAPTVATGNIKMAQGFNQPYAYGQPTLQTSQIQVKNVSLNSMDVSWKRGNGSKCIVFVNKTITDLPMPDSLTTYTANTEFGKGSQIKSSGWFCVFNDTLGKITVTGLAPSTRYRICAMEYNGISTKEAYLITAIKNSNYIDTVTPILQPTICIVTVASTIEKNLIVWDRISGANIARYNVYKISGSSKILIGSVPFSSVSQFIDSSSFPKVKAERYCITSFDSLGRESNYSPYHQTVNIQQNALGLIFTLYADESNTFVPEWYYVLAGNDSLNISIVDSLQSFQTIYNKSLPQKYVRFGVKKPIPCSPAILKAESGPYTQSLSNIVEYKVNSFISENVLNVSAFPNPFSEKLTIELFLDNNSDVTIEVINSTSQKTAEFSYKNLSSGNQQIQLNVTAMNISEGMCYLKIIAGNKTSVIKCNYIK